MGNMGHANGRRWKRYIILTFYLVLLIFFWDFLFFYTPLINGVHKHGEAVGARTHNLYTMNIEYAYFDALGWPRAEYRLQFFVYSFCNIKKSFFSSIHSFLEFLSLLLVLCILMLSLHLSQMDLLKYKQNRSLFETNPSIAE